MGAIGISAGVGAAGGVARQDLFERRDIARGGCHQLLRVAPQSQGKLQHVPGLLRFLPLGQFIQPSAIKLRPAQAFWIGGRIDLRHSPIGPSQLPARGRPMRPAVWRGTSQNAALAKDHHLTGLIQSLADQRHPRAAARHFGPAALDHLTDPFRSGPGFARAAPPHRSPRCANHLPAAIDAPWPKIRTSKAERAAHPRSAPLGRLFGPWARRRRSKRRPIDCRMASKSMSVSPQVSFDLDSS